MNIPDLPLNKKDLKIIQESIKSDLEKNKSNFLKRAFDDISIRQWKSRIESLMQKRHEKRRGLEKLEQEIAQARIKESHLSRRDIDEKLKEKLSQKSMKEAELKEIEGWLRAYTEELQKIEARLTNDLDSSIEKAEKQKSNMLAIYKTNEDAGKEINQDLASIQKQIKALDDSVTLTDEQIQSRTNLEKQRQELLVWQKEWIQVKNPMALAIKTITKQIAEYKAVSKQTHEIFIMEKKVRLVIPEDFSVAEARRFFNGLSHVWRFVAAELEDMKTDEVYKKEAKHILNLMEKKDVVGNSGDNHGILFKEFLKDLTDRDTYVLALALLRVRSKGVHVGGENPVREDAAAHPSR